MIKKIFAVTALSTALLFGGTFHSSAEAAAGNQSQGNNVYYFSVKGNWNDNSWLNDYVSKCLGNQWNYKAQHKKSGNQEKPKVEQPKAEQPKVEQPKVEQPKVEQPKVEQPKVEQPTQPAPEAPKQEQPNQAQSQLSQFEQQVVDLTNNERAKNGLSPLKIDYELSKVAREKSRDMATKKYFDHNSPTYGSPFDMMKSFGITYRSAGENIAMGQRTPQEVVNAWMNSPGHRANILNANFTHIGVGYVEQGNYWTQQFIGK